MAATGIRERLVVVVDRDNATCTSRVETTGVEAVPATQLEDLGARPDRQGVQNAALEEREAAAYRPLPVSIELVVEPLSRGAQEALDLVLEMMAGRRQTSQQGVDDPKWGDHRVV